ncbi:MAG: hypothetical protein Q8P41_01760 [Pseudomonadota bacterium]|nr:hypothetical protein [Pseudomonadota bacterium]
MIADLLSTLAAMVHGGALVAFALLINLRRAIPRVSDEDVIRVYRAFGGGFGVSLGVFIFSNLWIWWRDLGAGRGLPDAFSIPWDDTLTVARLVTFGAFWVSYVWLEIWTLDPLRLLDSGEIKDRAAYTRSVQQVATHIAINALLFLAVVTLGVLGAAP